MKIHSILHGSRVNGPGLRSVVWFQGCSLGCEGCQNPLTHPFDAGQDWNPEDLAEHIARNAADGTVGLTISGGEPLHQGASLYRLLCMIEAIRLTWDCGLFTGYTLAECTYGQFDLREPLPSLGTPERTRACLWEHQIREKLTWAKFGRYDRTRPVTDNEFHHRLCSSQNQFLTMFRRRWIQEDFAPLSLEMSIGADGLTQISGWPAINTNERRMK